LSVSGDRSRTISRKSPLVTRERCATARSGNNKPWPIKTPPFYAIPICVAITNYMGGVVVDGDDRGLDKND
jgi:hypothetical protein